MPHLPANCHLGTECGMQFCCYILIDRAERLALQLHAWAYAYHGHRHMPIVVYGLFSCHPSLLAP